MNLVCGNIRKKQGKREFKTGKWCYLAGNTIAWLRIGQVYQNRAVRMNSECYGWNSCCNRFMENLRQ